MAQCLALRPGFLAFAIDYWRNDSKTFEIDAAAPGKVIHIGWDWWSGNTMVISHDAGGKQDVYRTIYMHLQNGPDNDCANAWNKTMPNFNAADQATYSTYLNNTGCPQSVAFRNPKADWWGTNANKINMALLGTNVAAGQNIAYSGSTGPGGCGCMTGRRRPQHASAYLLRASGSGRQQVVLYRPLWDLFLPQLLSLSRRWRRQQGLRPLSEQLEKREPDVRALENGIFLLGAGRSGRDGAGRNLPCEPSTDTAASLDGFIATADDSLEWLFPLGDVNQTSYPDFIKEVGALAMGSNTYEWMLRHIVKPGSANPGAWPYRQPAWVFSTRDLPDLPNEDIRFVKGDVRPVHDHMRAAAKGMNLWLVGGGGLAGQFYDAGLLDEIIVQIGSVTLGSGKPLLPRAITSPSLKLVSVNRIGEGFAELRYLVPRR